MAAWTDKVLRWRPPGVLTQGPLPAYALVLGLTAVAAMLVFGNDERRPPLVEAEVPPTLSMPALAPQRIVGSLKLPARPAGQPLTNFRTLSPADRNDLIEVTPNGQRLPKIAASGWMPWIAYARRYDPDGPPARVGLLMINLGANEAVMKRAIDELPGEVSLAFLAATPDLPKWQKRAREHGHESYLMLPIDNPEGLAERGVKPIEAAALPDENVRRLRAAMARGEGYMGFVLAEPGPASQAEEIAQPLTQEIADRGLAVIEINPTPSGTALYRLAGELGVGYARSSTVLDYRLAGRTVAGNLDRLVEWTGETQPDRVPRHDFGVLQPNDAAIDAIVAWRKKLWHQNAVSFVPIIGHFECRATCMARLRAQPAQLRP
ncbi:MAG TPA: divergent polysaccharide deacetylase family protein [Reyranella sp.]|nr:divergent polysaccharide deacetylase family protein [Reyranella sp.]